MFTLLKTHPTSLWTHVWHLLFFPVQDENVRLSPARQMSLEDVVTYIAEDEMIDVSPSQIRIRYAQFSPHI